MQIAKCKLQNGRAPASAAALASGIRHQASGILLVVFACLLLVQLGCPGSGGNLPPVDQNAGTLDGFVYRRTLGVAQTQTGSNFILSATRDTSLGSPPLAGTRILLSGFTTFGATDSDGHFIITNVPAGVYDLTVVEEPPAGGLVSDVFSGILIVPGVTTHGAVPPAGLSVAVSSAGGTTVEAGQTLMLSAELRGADNQPIEGFADFAWSSSDNGVATVDSSGTVHGIGAGSATITAAAGPVSGTLDVTVTGSLPAVPAIIDFTAAAGPNGQQTQVSSLSILPRSPASLSLPAGAFFLFNNPDGSIAGSAPARVSGNGVELTSPVSLTGTTGPASILLQGTEDFLLSGMGPGMLSINRFLFRFQIFSPGATNLPSGIWQIPPAGGTTDDLSFTFTGLAPGTLVTVSLTLVGGTEVQASGMTGAGSSITLDSFSPSTQMANVTAITFTFHAP